MDLNSENVMKTKMVLPALIFTLLLSLTPANAGFIKDWLKKKFYIPKIEDSHVVLGRASRGALDPKHVKVFVWNIFKGSKKGFLQDFIYHGRDSDIFMLQEGTRHGVMEQAFEHFPGHRFDMGYSFINRSKKKGDIATGTVIGSSVEPSYVLVERTTDLEPIIKTPKANTIGYYPIEGTDKNLLIVNIHGMNMAGDEAFARHVDQCLEHIKNHDGPVIFAGDFNTKNNTRINYMVKGMHSTGMVPVLFRNDKRRKSKFSRAIIDYSFVRGLKIKDAWVLDKLKTSDHKAMVFEAEITDL